MQLCGQNEHLEKECELYSPARLPVLLLCAPFLSHLQEVAPGGAYVALQSVLSACASCVLLAQTHTGK